MPAIRFHATISIRGINPFVEVSQQHAETLRKHWRKPLPVNVRLNGAPKLGIKTNLMPIATGGFYLYLNTLMRKAANAHIGDAVLIELTNDHKYRAGPSHPIPASFKAALQANKQALTSWKQLSPSRQKEILRYFASLKTREALARNIAQATSVLAGAKGRWMARDWNDGH